MADTNNPTADLPPLDTTARIPDRDKPMSFAELQALDKPKKPLHEYPRSGFEVL